MEQNFLYMLEFVVDDVLVTRPNTRAPEGYPVCVEISFRSSVFVSICDREFGCRTDMCGTKCGKCCLFSLESPVTDKDRLLVHVYKKNTEGGKFLIGATDMAIKSHFDEVRSEFNEKNPNWLAKAMKHNANHQDCNKPVSTECDDELAECMDLFCPTSNSVRRLLPLFNMKGVQTGDLLISMRLVCNGPKIVSSPQFKQVCARLSKMESKKLTAMESKPDSEACEKSLVVAKKISEPTYPVKLCQRYFAVIEDIKKFASVANVSESQAYLKFIALTNGIQSCQRYFAGFDDEERQKGGCDTTRKLVCTRCKGGQCNDDFRCCCQDDCLDVCEEEDPCEEEASEEEEEIRPCFVCAPRKEPGPEAFEEFQACLNGSGVTIRVNKNFHCVEQVYDGGDEGIHGSHGCEHDNTRQCNGQAKPNCETFDNILRRSSYAQRELKKRTGGHYINDPKLPRIRANMKYTSNELGTCAEDNFRVPLGKIQEYCENRKQDGNVGKYVKPGTGLYNTGKASGCAQYRSGKFDTEDDCCMYGSGKPADDARACCVQVDPAEITNMMKNINLDTRKKGIDVCYKTTDETDSDVFLVCLGTKKSRYHKQKQIEIELKTPKLPLLLPKTKCNVETQINEAEIDAAITGKKKGKGKKGRGKKGKK